MSEMKELTDEQKEIVRKTFDTFYSIAESLGENDFFLFPSCLSKMLVMHAMTNRYSKERFLEKVGSDYDAYLPEYEAVSKKEYKCE